MIIWSVNPSNKEKIKDYQLHSREEIFGLIQAAYWRFKSWRSTSMEERKTLFRRAATILRDHKERYAGLITEEMGKPIKQARAEVEKCAWTCEVYADNIEEWMKGELVIADGIDHRVIFQPLGVILAIMPWNFPFWQVFRFAIPTIMVGNTSILKHSNNVPGCALAVQEVFQLAGFPTGIFTTILAGHEEVAELIETDYIQGISLTGSTSAGSRIASLAGKSLKKVFMELGGSDPFIVCEDADIDRAVENAIIGRTQNNGQSCIAAKRFIVNENIIEEFSKKFIKRMTELRIGDPRSEDTQIGPLANEGEFSLAKSLLADAIEKNAKLFAYKGSINEKGFFFKPTVVIQTTSEMKIVNEEVFAPIAPIIPFRNDDEAIEKLILRNLG